LTSFSNGGILKYGKETLRVQVLNSWLSIIDMKLADRKPLKRKLKVREGGDGN